MNYSQSYGFHLKNHPSVVCFTVISAAEGRDSLGTGIRTSSTTRLSSLFSASLPWGREGERERDT